MSERLLGIVLVGGRSSRMGTDKASLPHAGTTFLVYALDRLGKVCESVAVSGQTDAAHDVTVIDDPIKHQGPATGIAASLRFARDNRFDACLITPVDTPALTDQGLVELCDAWKRCHKLTVARTDRIEPLVGIYPVDLADSIDALSTAQDRSLHRWIAGQDHTALPFPADHLNNINTSEDLSNYGCQ